MHNLVLGIGFGIISASVLAISALGFDLTVAVSDVLNIGFISFMLVGQFLALGFQNLSGQLWVGIVAGAILTGVLGVLLFRLVVAPFTRRGTPQFVIVLILLGVAVIVQSGLTAALGSVQYNYTLSNFFQGAIHPVGMLFTVAQGIVILATIGILLFVDSILRYTRLGRNVRAIADDEKLARSSGVPVDRVTDLIWGVSGALGGIAGIFLAIEEVSFSTTTDQTYFVLIIAAAFLGGAGKPYGAAIGALLIGVVVQVSAIWVRGDLTPLIGFLALIVVIIFRPTGILGSAKGELRA